MPMERMESSSQRWYEEASRDLHQRLSKEEASDLDWSLREVFREWAQTMEWLLRENALLDSKMPAELVRDGRFDEVLAVLREQYQRR